MLALVGAAVVGLLVGFCAVMVHREAWRPSGDLLPWGLVLGLGTTFACQRASALLTGAAGAFVFAGGWIALMFVVADGRPEGDFLLAQDFLVEAFFWGGRLVLLVGAVLAMLVSAGSRRGLPRVGGGAIGGREPGGDTGRELERAVGADARHPSAAARRPSSPLEGQR